MMARCCADTRAFALARITQTGSWTFGTTDEGADAPPVHSPGSPMKAPSLLLAGILAGASCSSLASAQLLAYDGFGNGPLADLNGSNGGTGWSGVWLDQTFDAVTAVTGDGLQYPGLDTTPGAAVTEVGGGVYPMSSYYRSYAPLPLGTNAVYVSFLLRADANFGGWGGLEFGTYPYAMTVGVPLGMYAFGLMTSEGLGDISAADVIEGQTYFVVVKISKNVGNGTTYRLYLNPTVGQTEPAFPVAMYGLGPVNALPTALRIDNGGGYTTDEVRVGTTWASVLPLDPGCLGDFNQDLMVNATDLAMLIGAWGTAVHDLNGDHVVGAADLAIVLGAWGSCQ